MEWLERASCRGEDPDLFFPIGNTGSGLALLQVEEAKKVCARCPVRGRCLDWALGTEPVDGVWGGTTEGERRALHGGAPHVTRHRTAVDTDGTPAEDGPGRCPPETGGSGTARVRHRPGNGGVRRNRRCAPRSV